MIRIWISKSNHILQNLSPGPSTTDLRAYPRTWEFRLHQWLSFIISNKRTLACLYTFVQKSFNTMHFLHFLVSTEGSTQACKFFTDNNNALCCFLCRKLSIGKFKRQVSFSGSFVSDQNVWNALSLSSIYLGASWLQAHKPANLQKNQ